ncbi:MAG: hypothetical protein KGM24_09805, partial [Elusimicrobia bacterium]|nr:hypothetical protein [Elusimicrobiota bacterium]
MSAPSAGTAAAAAGLTGVVAAAAAWWTFVFRRQLPLERALRQRKTELDAARVLAGRLLDAQALARRPGQALAEA